MNTAKKLFEHFLYSVRKERTAVISPEAWTLFMEGILLDWVKLRLPETEYIQKRIDDLEAIHVVTDGILHDMIEADENGLYPIPTDPKYLHGLSATFAYYYNPVGEDEIIGGDERTQIVGSNTGLLYKTVGRILRADNRGMIESNPYRKPKSTRIYFDLRESFIYLSSGDTSFNRLILEYYKYPEKITFTSSGEDSTGSFNESQNKEIVDLAIRKYLERVRDPRHQSFGAEQMSIPQ